MSRPQTPLVSVDMVIELLDAPGQIVRIERRHPPPGWALPGGFVDVGETAEHAGVRSARAASAGFRSRSDLGRLPALAGAAKRRVTRST